MRNFKAEFFKVLAHPLRIQILDQLRGGPISVNELKDRLGVEQSTVSQQLAVLRAGNFVQSHRDGTTVRYQISDAAIFTLLDSARATFDNQLVSVRATLEELARESGKA